MLDFYFALTSLFYHLFLEFLFNDYTVRDIFLVSDCIRRKMYSFNKYKNRFYYSPNWDYQKSRYSLKNPFNLLIIVIFIQKPFRHYGSLYLF